MWTLVGRYKTPPGTRASLIQVFIRQLLYKRHFLWGLGKQIITFLSHTHTHAHTLILTTHRYGQSLTNFLGDCGAELYPGQQHREVDMQVTILEALH